MSEHIQNYLGNYNYIVPVSGTNLDNAVMGQNMVVLTSGIASVINIPTDLYLSGRQFSVSDHAGLAAQENIVISGTDINGSTTYTLDAAYETVTLVSNNTDAWVALNTQS